MEGRGGGGVGDVEGGGGGGVMTKLEYRTLNIQQVKKIIQMCVET